MVRDYRKSLEHVIKNSLVINPEYLKLPEVPVENRTIKEYALYGDLDIEELQNNLNKDLIESGNDEMSAYELWYSVSEAVENAQEHQYNWKKYDDEGNLNEIKLFCQYTPIYDLISVQSKGSLDMDHIKNLLEENKNLRFGKRGRGFHIMTQFCDGVHILSDDDKEYLDIVLIKMKKGDVIITDYTYEKEPFLETLDTQGVQAKII